MSILSTPLGIALPPSQRSLTAQGSGQDDPRRVADMAHQFESLFIGQMLRQMRQSLTMAGDDEDDRSSKPFEAMTEQMDTALAQNLSENGGLGIAQVIIDAFKQQQGSKMPGSIGVPSGAAAPVQAPVQVPLTTPQPPVALPPVKGAGVRLDAGRLHAPATTPAPTDAAVPMPASHVTSKFGWRHDPLTGKTKFHKGVDLRAAYGQPVASVAPGRVVQAGADGGYGLSVVVEHGSGIRTRYAHLSELSVKTGDAVGDGETIGKAGQSGRSTGPHVHFEILAGGRPVDPVEAAQRFKVLGELKPVRAVADSPNGWPSTGTAAEE